MNKPKKEFYFSFRSPYSWLAFNYLKNNNKNLLKEIELIPFWEPDNKTSKIIEEKGGKFIYTPMTKEKHLYILSDIKRFTNMFNIDMKWPVDREPRWEISHLPFIFIEEVGNKIDYMNEIYSLRWEKGLDISSPEIVSIALESVGYDPEIVDLIDTPKVREQGANILMKIYHSSVFGVPFFINGNEKFWGIDRLRLFIDSFSDDHKNYIEDRKSDFLSAQLFEFDVVGGCG